ncbi:uncharacterized protein LOC135817273 isoform X3 [Sycon ciliatum]|uniref:uncharacterized protein LOC135817273 isoform X3 n=1 Tax=Sycon ciliatum TaxID=27933 RepID=UPI0031F68D3A
MQRMRRKHSYGAGSRYCTTSWYGALRSAMCNRNYHGDTADHRVKRCEMQQSIRRFDRRPGDKRGADRRSLQCPSWFGAAPSADVGTWSSSIRSCLRGCHFSHQRRLVRRSH